MIEFKKVEETGHNISTSEHEVPKDKLLIPRPSKSRAKSEFETSHKAKDLMILVGKAIDEWARIYDMQDLPNEFIFEQALAIMNSVNRSRKK